jgi:anti-sigma B factor antagonist
MALSVKEQKRGGIVVLQMAGRLTVGDPILRLREVVQRHIAEGDRIFLLDLTDLAYIDSAGLGELVCTCVSVRRRNGDVKLLNLSNQVKDVLHLTNLLSVFDTYTDETIGRTGFIGSA